jgi:apolipoprotein D and lipocalin family protein
VKPAARLLLLVSALVPLAHAEEARMTPVPTLDLQRYAGAWYEIARLPNPFQKKCAHSVVVHYSVRDEGRLDVVNECVWGDYWVIDLAPDYSYAVIGGPKREYLWILSREPRMPETVYAEILARASRF